ncbi:hypothetical protein AE73_05399 [Klebsiella pneumoniae CHS 17]|nr:hypothetical protein AE73_05399 [Klebsiella pneumoniae CHS 17]
MGFPSPATDYQENRLSLDQHCNTGAPGVFFFRSDTYSFREGIKPGALLIVDFGGTPVDGSLVLCVLEQEFRIMRLRLHPKRCLQELDKLDNFRAIPDDDEDGSARRRAPCGRCRCSCRAAPRWRRARPSRRERPAAGTVAKLAMRQPFVLFKGLTFQKLCLPGAFRPGDHHNKMLRPGLCVVHASPQYL